jgi:hypothetical protein
MTVILIGLQFPAVVPFANLQRDTDAVLRNEPSWVAGSAQPPRNHLSICRNSVSLQMFELECGVLASDAEAHNAELRGVQATTPPQRCSENRPEIRRSDYRISTGSLRFDMMH